MKLLDDRARNSAFHRALKAVIEKNKTSVADLGSGTGFLSFLAEKLGAKTCYLYESDPEMLFLSKKLAAENQISRCEFFNFHSTDVRTPPKVDVVVSETLGNFALEENILETMRDAKRFLKPNGIMIPQKLVQYAAPVTSAKIYEKINVWDRVGFGLSMNQAKRFALANMYVQTFKPADLLGKKSGVKILDEVDFLSSKTSSIRPMKAEWKILKSETVYGFAVWWTAELIPGIELSTSPFCPPTHWEQIFLPLATPIKTKAGQILKLHILSDSRLSVGIRVSWKALTG